MKIGRYEIQKELGRGAMGVVYSATDPLIGRQVAIKTIRLGALEVQANRADLTERLRREARAAGVLSHPGIITIHDQGEQGEDAYIVMEFIDGSTVEEMLDSAVPQQTGNLLSILKKAADALDYAHSKGIIHRDIKPSNLMVCTDGTVKIADFGIAKLNASTSLTQSGFVLGTPNYMSPEQAQGRTIEGSSDQFSLAVVAYRMLTGTLPFEGPSLTALLAKILWEEPDYQSAGLNPPVRSVFEKALSKDPQRRYMNCAEFVRELQLAHDRVGTAAYKNSTAGQTTFVVHENKEASHPAPVPSTKKKSALLASSVGAGILILAVIAFFFVKAAQKPAPSSQRTSTGAVTDKLKTQPSAISEIPSPAEPTVQPKNQELPATPPLSPKAKPDLRKTAVPKISTLKPKQVDNSSPQPEPASGVLTWSGKLEKNSILIIADKATIGSIEGRFPGKPIAIDAEPNDLIIRQRPGENNGWNQVILYSGNRRYESIRIRWRLVN